jgi:hypothetical protein
MDKFDLTVKLANKMAAADGCSLMYMHEIMAKVAVEVFWPLFNAVNTCGFDECGGEVTMLQHEHDEILDAVLCIKEDL